MRGNGRAGARWRMAALVAGTCAAAPGGAAAAEGPSAPAAADAARRGAYLVNGMGCNDCHTPNKMGASGPEPDMTRMLSGHPESLAMPPAPPLSGPWMATVAATMTAWAGPWGVSYTANLTPDSETGLGRWTEQQFVDTIRSGRHLGRGRQILPPMPWPAIRNMTDDDLKAIFAYLRTIPPIRNKVPDPLPPAGAPAQ
jgi:mono/diheme cytochrome c family protein